MTQDAACYSIPFRESLLEDGNVWNSQVNLTNKTNETISSTLTSNIASDP